MPPIAAKRPSFEQRHHTPRISPRNIRLAAGISRTEEREIHGSKSRIRARVEHVFHVVKRIFGFVKVRYRGIAKNAHRLVINFALANLYLHRRRLVRLGA
jgi:IS5 family transposase